MRLAQSIDLFAISSGRSVLHAQRATQPPAELPDAPAAPTILQPTGPTAVIDTSMGRITCKLYEKEAPEAVANFIGLAEGTKDWTDPATHKKMHRKSLYNGTSFHRVIPEFMIQGGDPTGTGMGDPGYSFKDEFNDNLGFTVPGRLAMANSGPDTNGSQSFITEVPTEYPNQKHTIFGSARSGLRSSSPSLVYSVTLNTISRHRLCRPRSPSYAKASPFRRHLPERHPRLPPPSHKRN
jgi:peptidyl-prolyl cis-trans isomerase A (cyclophilin A)